MQKMSNVFSEHSRASHGSSMEPCSPQQACRGHPLNRRAIVTRENTTHAVNSTNEKGRCILRALEFVGFDHMPADMEGRAPVSPAVS